MNQNLRMCKGIGEEKDGTSERSRLEEEGVGDRAHIDVLTRRTGKRGSLESRRSVRCCVGLMIWSGFERELEDASQRTPSQESRDVGREINLREKA